MVLCLRPNHKPIVLLVGWFNISFPNFSVEHAFARVILTVRTASFLLVLVCHASVSGPAVTGDVLQRQRPSLFRTK